MCSPSLLITCPYQFNLLSVIFLEACATLVVPRMCSFLILSLRVTPHIHRRILISVTSIRFSCLFVVAHVSAPYSIAGLITVLYTFPFSFTGILLFCIPSPSVSLAFFCFVYLPLQFHWHPSVLYTFPFSFTGILLFCIPSPSVSLASFCFVYLPLQFHWHPSVLYTFPFSFTGILLFCIPSPPVSLASFCRTVLRCISSKLSPAYPRDYLFLTS